MFHPCFLESADAGAADAELNKPALSMIREMTREWTLESSSREEPLALNLKPRTGN